MVNDVTWLCEEREQGDLVSRIGRRGRELIAEFADVGTLRADGSSAVFEAAKGADPRLVEKFRAGAATALLRHLDAKLSLHGAAVAKDGRAIVFVAASGGGKSTIAAD